MNTTFTITMTKGNGVCYAVDLGCDILDGKDNANILNHARKDMVVELQNHKGSLLRTSTGPDELQATIWGLGYPEATVEIYIPSTPKKELTVDELIERVKAGKIDKAVLKARLAEL